MLPLRCFGVDIKGLSPIGGAESHHHVSQLHKNTRPREKSFESKITGRESEINIGRYTTVWGRQDAKICRLMVQ